MKELILIQGAELPVVVSALRNVVRMLGDDDSITELHLSATQDRNTFALQPNRFCPEWSFIALCYLVQGEFSDNGQVHLDAWLRTNSNALDNVPVGKNLYINFINPRDNEIIVVDPKGCRYDFVDYTDKESGAECMQTEKTGFADYKPLPKLQLHKLPAGQGLFEVGKPDRKRTFSNILYWMNGNNLSTLLIVLLFSSLMIISLCGAWDFSETVLPFSLSGSRWILYAVFAAMGLIMALSKVVFKIFNFWGRFFFGTVISAMAAGLLLVIVFSVNRWFESPEPICGSGTVVEVDARGKSDSDLSYNYHVDVVAPTEGKLFIRMHHDNSFAVGDNVNIILHRGLYGLYHAEKIEH